MSLFLNKKNWKDEGLLEGYTAYRKKRNPDYNHTKLKKITDCIIKIFIVIIILTIFLFIVFIIEHFYPNLLDIIIFD